MECGQQGQGQGHDTEGRLRLVGGNYFNEPRQRHDSSNAPLNFFEQFEKADIRGQQQLLKDALEKSIKPEDAEMLMSISHECEHFHTMPIYITVLTGNGSLFHAGKAVIEGVKPADFSDEFFGEIK